MFAIQKSDMDLRRTLFSNIVLSGGSTLFKGWSGLMGPLVKILSCRGWRPRELIWGGLFFSAHLGFGDRLLSEVKKLAPKDVKIRVGAYWRSGWVELGSKDWGARCVPFRPGLQALQATTAL